MKVELYENANLLTKFLLLFVIEKMKIKSVYDTKNNDSKYNYITVVQFKVLFGVKYITRQYYIN